MTIEGPMLSFPCSRTLLVAVGKTNTGPAPQINLCGLAGDKKKVGLMSPKPKTPALFCALGQEVGRCIFFNTEYLQSAVPGAGCQITGVIQRIIKFQFSLTRKGITGWMFRTF
jgi:hypothetical protein